MNSDINQENMDSGQKRLHELGYKQELRRSLSVLGNFSMCFSVISIIGAITISYNTGLTYGGPVSIIYGWILGCSFTMCVALSMAEICSAYPTSGGLYFWSFKLAGVRYGPFASWMTGWFNIVGLWVAVASGVFGVALLIQVIILFISGGIYYPSKYVVMGICTGILILIGLMNCLNVNWLSWFGSSSALCNFLGVFVMGITLLIVSPRQNASYVFTHFNTNNGNGIHSKPYIFLLGLLVSQFTILGYDTSAHMSEETKTADKYGAYGIVTAVGGSIVIGFGFLLALSFVSGNIPHLIDINNDAKGYGVAQLVYDAFEYKFDDGKWGVLLLIIPCLTLLLSCLTAVTATSRDGALPLSNLWHKLNKDEVPVNAVWLCIGIIFCVILPYLGSTMAFQATASITTIALNIAYAIPIFLRVTISRRTFTPGPFYLGRYSIFIGWIAVLWVMFITILFCLPLAYPVRIENLNYTPVALGGLSLFNLVYWGLSAHRWFKGPIPNVSRTNIG